jgi:hypothetical protein
MEQKTLFEALPFEPEHPEETPAASKSIVLEVQSVRHVLTTGPAPERKEENNG